MKNGERNLVRQVCVNSAREAESVNARVGELQKEGFGCRILSVFGHRNGMNG